MKYEDFLNMPSKFSTYDSHVKYAKIILQDMEFSGKVDTDHIDYLLDLLNDYMGPYNIGYFDGYMDQACNKPFSPDEVI